MLPRIKPEVTAVDPVKAGLNAMLPGVVPRAIFGEAEDAVTGWFWDAQRVDVGAQARASVLLEHDLARGEIVDEKAVVGDA